MAADADRFEAVLDRLVAIARERATLSAARTFELKSDNTRVTAIDREIEQVWRAEIGEVFPDHGILGEEFGASDGNSDYVWVLDPIDGTDDFSRGLPLFGYIIAVLYRGSPVVAAVGHPVLGIDLRATRGNGVRMNGESLPPLDATGARDKAIVLPAYDDFSRDDDQGDVLLTLANAFRNYRVFRNVYGHSAVIRGAYDAGLEFDVRGWDIYATQLCIREAGGEFRYFRVTRSRGETRYGAVFGRGDTVASICELLSTHGFTCRDAADVDAFTPD